MVSSSRRAEAASVGASVASATATDTARSRQACQAVRAKSAPAVALASAAALDRAASMRASTSGSSLGRRPSIPCARHRDDQAAAARDRKLLELRELARQPFPLRLDPLTFALDPRPVGGLFPHRLELDAGRRDLADPGVRGQPGGAQRLDQLGGILDADRLPAQPLDRGPREHSQRDQDERDGEPGQPRARAAAPGRDHGAHAPRRRADHEQRHPDPRWRASPRRTAAGAALVRDVDQRLGLGQRPQASLELARGSTLAERGHDQRGVLLTQGELAPLELLERPPRDLQLPSARQRADRALELTAGPPSERRELIGELAAAILRLLLAGLGLGPRRTGGVGVRLERSEDRVDDHRRAHDRPHRGMRARHPRGGQRLLALQPRDPRAVVTQGRGSALDLGANLGVALDPLELGQRAAQALRQLGQPLLLGDPQLGERAPPLARTLIAGRLTTELLDLGGEVQGRAIDHDLVSRLLGLREREPCLAEHGLGVGMALELPGGPAGGAGCVAQPDQRGALDRHALDLAPVGEPVIREERRHARAGRPDRRIELGELAPVQSPTLLAERGDLVLVGQQHRVGRRDLRLLLELLDPRLLGRELHIVIPLGALQVVEAPWPGWPPRAGRRRARPAPPRAAAAPGRVRARSTAPRSAAACARCARSPAAWSRARRRAGSARRWHAPPRSRRRAARAASPRAQR